MPINYDKEQGEREAARNNDRAPGTGDQYIGAIAPAVPSLVTRHSILFLFEFFVVRES